MTILYACSEGPHLDGGRGYADYSYNVDLNYSRAGKLVAVEEAVVFDWGVPVSDDLWIRCNLTKGTRAGNSCDNRAWKFYRSDGTLALQISGVNSILYWNRYDAAGGLIDNQTNQVVFWSVTAGIDTFTPLDFHIWQDGADVKFELYSDEMMIDSVVWTGYTMPSIQKAEINNPTNYDGSVTPDNANDRMVMSEVVVAQNESTFGMRVKTVVPTGNGTYQEWDNSDYTKVDDREEDLDMISSTTTGQKSTFTHSDTLSAIRALVVAPALAAAGAAAPKALIRTNGADYTKDFQKTLTAGVTGNVAVFENNPATNQGWTAAELAALEFGIQS